MTNLNQKHSLGVKLRPYIDMTFYFLLRIAAAKIEHNKSLNCHTFVCSVPCHFRQNNLIAIDF